MAERSGLGAWTHVPAIDGLRALAIGGVVLFHGGVPFMPGGFLGVDLFFVISGWLITSLLLREMDGTGWVRLGAFWARRARRLLPAVILMLGAVVVWWSWHGGIGQRLAVLDDAPWGLFYVANWHDIADGAGYWVASETPSPLAHLWSLAIEEQFYLVWPLVVAAVAMYARRRHKTLLTVASVGIVASATASLLLFDPSSPDRAYMGTDVRASSILVGAALATGPMRRTLAGLAARTGRWRELALGSVVAAIAAMWVLVDGESDAWLFRGGLLAHSVLCGVLVATVAAHEDGRIAAWLARPLVQWVGRRSYGLYLWHWPVFVWFDAERTGFDGVFLFLGRLAITLGAAELSYQLVEAPIRWRFAWARQRDGVAVAASSMLALAAVVSFLPRPADEVLRPSAADVSAQLHVGPRSEVTSAVVDAQASSGAKPRRATTPSKVPPPPSSASEATPGGGEGESGRSDPPAVDGTTVAPAPRVEVRSVQWFGDSVADDLAPGVTAAFYSAGVAVTNNAFPGESLTGGFMLDRGKLWLYDELPSMIEQGADVAVWVLSHWDFGADADVALNTHRLFVELALAHHGAVVFVGSPPMEPDEYEDGRFRLHDSVRALEQEYPGRVYFLDAAAVWGDEFVDRDPGGVPLRKPDGIHICPLGASRLASYLVNELAMRFDGITPAAPETWALGGWWDDKRYHTPPGSCA